MNFTQKSRKASFSAVSQKPDPSRGEWSLRANTNEINSVSLRGSAVDAGDEAIQSEDEIDAPLAPVQGFALAMTVTTIISLVLE